MNMLFEGSHSIYICGKQLIRICDYLHYHDLFMMKLFFSLCLFQCLIAKVVFLVSMMMTCFDFLSLGPFFFAFALGSNIVLCKNLVKCSSLIEVEKPISRVKFLFNCLV